MRVTREIPSGVHAKLEFNPTFEGGMYNKTISTLSSLYKSGVSAGFVADDTTRLPGRLRTAKEASQLLEELRNSYRQLAPNEQRAVKSFMSDICEQLRRTRVG